MANSVIPSVSRRDPSSAASKADAPVGSADEELVGQQIGQQIGRQGQRARQRDPSLNPRALLNSNWSKESSDELASKAKARTRTR